MSYTHLWGLKLFGYTLATKEFHANDVMSHFMRLLCEIYSDLNIAYWYSSAHEPLKNIF